MEDQRDILKDKAPFTYQMTKNGLCMLFYDGKHIKTIKGKEVIKLENAIKTNDTYQVQMVLAKLTGNFKRGNERNQ